MPTAVAAAASVPFSSTSMLAWWMTLETGYPFARTTRNSMLPLSWTVMRPAMLGASIP
jgi:hypothetical protein